MNIEELLSRDDVTEIIRLASQNNIDSNQLLSNDKFKETLYNYFSRNGVSYNVMRPLIEYAEEKACIDSLDLEKVKEAAGKTTNVFFTTLMENGNSAAIDKIIEDKEYRKCFFENLEYNYSIISSCDSKKVEELLEQVNSSNEELPNISYLVDGLDKEAKKKVLNGEYKKELFLSAANRIDKDDLQDYINNNPKALYEYKEIGIIKLAQKGITFPSDIIKQKDFFERLKSEDLVEFRRRINIVNRNSYSNVLQRKVDKYYDDIVNDFNIEKGIFNKYDLDNIEDINGYLTQSDSDYIMNYDARKCMQRFGEEKERYNDLKQQINSALREKCNVNLSIDELMEKDIIDITDDSELTERLEYLKDFYTKTTNDFEKEKGAQYENLRNITSGKLGEVVVDSLFQDTKNNVQININEMRRYNKHLPKENKVLNKNQDDLYSKFQNIDSLSGKEKYELYQNLKDKNMVGQLYQDFSELKNKSYEEIASVLYNPEKNWSDISVSDTEKNDIETYKLDGKEYYALVRVMNTPYHSQTRNEISCYSLIGGKNSSVYNGEYIYGYGNIDPKTIVNVFESDSYTLSSGQDITERPNRIMSPEEIVESSSSYSEINIQNKKIEKDGKTVYEEMKPSYLMCNGEPTKEQIEEGKRLNIPVVDMCKEKYKENRTNQMEYELYDRQIN